MTGKNPTHIGDKRAGDRRNKEEKGEWVTQSSMAKEFFFEEKTREKNDSDCKKKIWIAFCGSARDRRRLMTQ